jgi:outer membrane lipoprotein-sorting protein
LLVNSAVCYVLNVRFVHALAGFSCALLAAKVPAQEPDPFTELHERAREVERNLVTLRADFVETTESDLLVEPVIESGKMIAARPIRVLLRYEKPEKRLLLIDGDQLLMVWPERARSERMPIAKIQQTVDKYFYQASEKELRGQFDIHVTLDPELPGTSLIEMIAKRKQIQKGLERLELWVEDRTLYMVKMRLVYPGGAGSKTIELSNLLANVPVEDEEFRVELPSETSDRPRGFHARAVPTSR